MSLSVALRPPRARARPNDPAHTPPSIDWLAGTWYVVHSSLPMWQSKRNVCIRYEPHPPSANPSDPPLLDDIVSYQTLSSDKTKTILGIDTVSEQNDTGVFDWRGKGWLKIASSHWEVLGWGEHNDGTAETGAPDATAQWAVTYFSKTLFTPAGIDIYSRQKGLHKEAVDQIKKALHELDHPDIRELVDSMFEIAHG